MGDALDVRPLQHHRRGGSRGGGGEAVNGPANATSNRFRIRSVNGHVMMGEPKPGSNPGEATPVVTGRRCWHVTHARNRGAPAGQGCALWRALLQRPKITPSSP